MARINKVLLVFLHFGSPRPYSVCALCRFSRSGTRPDHTLYVRCANFRAPAHVATILCMCHVPLFALRHTLRQEKAEKCRKGCNSCSSCISCISCSSCISCNSCNSRIVCRRCRFPARSFANKKLTLSCRIFSDTAFEGQFIFIAFFLVFLFVCYSPFLSSSVNFAMVPGMSICCGHTAAQAPHPMHADGSLFSSNAASAIGAMNPPSLYACSL